MRPRQWFLSLVLFSVSLSFLFFSKYFFAPTSLPHSVAAAIMPDQATKQGTVVMLANNDYYLYLKQYFQKAQKNIVGTVFLFKTAPFRGNEPAALLRELIAARKRKVNVDLILEISAENKDYNDANRYAGELLRKSGVNVRYDELNVTTHAKAFVIDDRYCFVGSHNFTHAALAMNEELSLFVDSPELAGKIKEFIRQIPVSTAQ
jgi:polyphosphate kinase